MTFGIVIPLKSKKISRDWNVTSGTLERTINSVLAQTDGDFIVVVAGHDKPEFMDGLSDKRIRFVSVDFPIPDRAAPDFTNQLLINDKVLKIMQALIELKEENLSWIYQLDSDDLIRCDFIERIKQLPPADAVIVEGGYVYYDSCERIVETEEIDQLCGSIAVVKPSSFNIPPSADLDYIHDIPWTKYRHRSIFRFFDETKVIRTKERLLTYVLASGDNFSDRWRIGALARFKATLKPYIKGKKVGLSFKKAFGLS